MKKIPITFHQHLPFFRHHGLRVQTLRNTLIQLCNDYNKRLKQLDIIYVDDDELLQMNKNYLQHDYYTDIITFDLGSEKDTIIGELYISRDRVIDNAATIQSTVIDEILRVSIHGLLHLCGMNDSTQEEKSAMRAAENTYISFYKTIL